MIYEYLCATCHEEFCVVEQKPPKPNPPCPNCGGEKIFRKVADPNDDIKRDGFYNTDKKDDGS
jgi:putative FmdB family regulatory protein